MGTGMLLLALDHQVVLRSTKTNKVLKSISLAHIKPFRYRAVHGKNEVESVQGVLDEVKGDCHVSEDNGNDNDNDDDEGEMVDGEGEDVDGEGKDVDGESEGICDEINDVYVKDIGVGGKVEGVCGTKVEGVGDEVISVCGTKVEGVGGEVKGVCGSKVESVGGCKAKGFGGDYLNS